MKNNRDNMLEDDLYKVQTTDHPLWPSFKAWADKNIPGMMLDAYWRAFLTGAEAAKEVAS